ncbi:VOC family protein [Natronomonas sp.]|uniref:VOC family protein n=1 Tax=Natronomonas sp. TaxID=2184060 RepID=UPI002611289F|nr:VOC family protein [Natronomonas sp.]
MNVRRIDHLNLRIPEDGVETAVRFYADRLGFGIEGLERYRDGEQSFFDVRLAPAHVIHLWPTAAFDPPEGNNYDHVALVVEADIAALKTALGEAGVVVENERQAPRGATGEAPAVYVEDPFGYRIELKAGEPAD